MDDRATLSAAPAATYDAPLGTRLEKYLGRDWKIALPFVLPMLLLMAGLIWLGWLTGDLAFTEIGLTSPAAWLTRATS